MHRRAARLTALAAIATVMLVAQPARAQGACPAFGMNTIANCGGDTCSCALPCTASSQCNSGCCIQGFCALRCVCDPDGGAVVDAGCTPAPDVPTEAGCRGSAAAATVLPLFGIARRRQKDRKGLK